MLPSRRRPSRKALLLALLLLSLFSLVLAKDSKHDVSPPFYPISAEIARRTCSFANPLGRPRQRFRRIIVPLALDI